MAVRAKGALSDVSLERVCISEPRGAMRVMPHAVFQGSLLPRQERRLETDQLHAQGAALEVAELAQGFRWAEEFRDPLVFHELEFDAMYGTPAGKKDATP